MKKEKFNFLIPTKLCGFNILMAELVAFPETVLDFENQTFIELLSEDGLIIMARGLGLDRLFLKFLKLYCDPHNLVLVLNMAAAQESYYTEELSRDCVEHLPKSLSNEYTAKDRELLYMQGGVLFITSRILVVDLLRKLCPVEKVTGILVCNAHRVKDSSMEAFILTLYREKNKAGFIKAFSDCPEPFTNGFCQLERVMRNLFLRHVYLWPRFHATVSASLSRNKPDVIELRQQMTPSMVAIQMAVLDIMKACVSELKRNNPTLDTDDVTVENCMNKSFNQVIKRQLDPIWNELGGKTKQLIFDLRMLRTLLYFLTQYDCVTFLSYLNSIRSSNDTYAFASTSSSWLFMDAANTLFVKSRERVFGNPKQSKEKSNTTDKEPVLEESPKWRLLSMVLEEIQQETEANDTIESSSSKVLVVVQDERTSYQLKEYLCDGGRKLLQRQYDKLSTKITNTQLDQGLASTSDGGSSTKVKGHKRPLPPGNTDGGAKKKRKTKSEDAELEKCEETGMEDDSSEAFMKELTNFRKVFDDSESEGSNIQSVLGHFGLLNGPVVILHALTANDNPYHMTKLLRELRPRFIVLYDADVQLVRQVEVYKASHPGMPLRVYFLLYDSSVEEQKYLTSLRKEKEAFQQLIKERAHMVVPVDREGKVGDSSLLRRASPTTDAVSTRKAGGRTEDKGPQSVLVDIREFRSSLPFLVHRRGIDINPLTLEVGDYILSPDMCVERKSVSDLIGSLNSGRLYNQATAMTRHYKKPVLLIEFNDNESFSLQTMGAIHSDISYQSVASKLVLLTLHFPNLRIIWCSSPNATSELFEQLKSGQPQPDPKVALAIGQDSLDKVEGTSFNPLLQDFLLKLPGINSKNYRSVMTKVSDLQELVSLSEKEIEQLLGHDANAKLLWTFLHTETQVNTRTKNSRKKV